MIWRAPPRPREKARQIAATKIAFESHLLPLVEWLHRYGASSIKDIADADGRDHSIISRQVTKLEAMGVVRREGIKSDARVRIVALTVKGDVAAREIFHQKSRLVTLAPTRWNDADIIAIYSTIARLAGDINLAAGNLYQAELG